MKALISAGLILAFKCSFLLAGLGPDDIDRLRKEMLLPSGATIETTKKGEITLIIAKNESGKVLSVAPIKHGVNHGLTRTFREDGTSSIICYKEGKMLFFFTFDRSGNLIRGSMLQGPTSPEKPSFEMWFTEEGLWKNGP